MLLTHLPSLDWITRCAVCFTCADIRAGMVIFSQTLYSAAFKRACISCDPKILVRRLSWVHCESAMHCTLLCMVIVSHTATRATRACAITEVAVHVSVNRMGHSQHGADAFVFVLRTVNVVNRLDESQFRWSIAQQPARLERLLSSAAMDEPPPPGLEPEVYYAPAPQVAPAPIPTVYQPPPVQYIPPHPNPPLPEAPAVLEVQKEATPEPPKPRAPKPSVSVLQGGRKLALGTQKSNLASRLVARSSHKQQTSPRRTKQAGRRSDGQPHAEAVFAASPPPQELATDVSPEAGIPEPVPAYPAHVEGRPTSASPSALLPIPPDCIHHIIRSTCPTSSYSGQKIWPVNPSSRLQDSCNPHLHEGPLPHVGSEHRLVHLCQKHSHHH